MSDKVDSAVRKKAKEKPPVSTGEMVVEIPLPELYSFPDHPFAVRDDESMQETAESVKKYGVLVPGIVRPRAGGGYEIIAGHRRKHASELAGRATMPCLIRDLDDDTATIIMVDSNLQRENILPSERAKAMQMKLEALKRQAGRRSKNAPNNSAHFRSDDEIGEAMGMSGDTVRNIISLTQLQPDLMALVDSGKISVTPAYSLAALKPEEQKLLLDTMESEQTTPSVSQAQRLKKLSQEDKLNEDTILEIMAEQKKPETYSITLSSDKLSKYFPKSYTPKRIEETILKLLEGWMKKRQRAQER